ncbi:hypothetical protein ACG9ZL_11750 [Acinetobacter sp. ULE_I057]|uniref:hypothetical protein n=1 Tax=Acinetobacter sp. ULE_I057 TaxID=3373070 RepID=UPI003AF896CC
MYNGKIDKKNLLSGVIFFISPLIGLLVAMHGIKKRQLNFFYILLSLFFALMVLKNPPLYDLIRYLDLFDSSRNIELVFHNYFSFQLVSTVFNELRIPFYFLPSLFVFFIIFLHLKAIDIVYNYFDWSIKRQLLLIFGLVILINPIFASTVLRAYLASGFFMYGVFLVIFKEKKIGYILVLFSAFFHLSFAYLIIFFILSRFFKISKNIAFVVSLFSIMFSFVFISYLIDFIPFELIKIQFSNYLTNTNTGADSGSGNFQAFIVNSILALTNICFALLYFMNVLPKVEKAKEYSNFLNFLIISGCLASISFIVFIRYFTHITLFSYVYIVVFLVFINGRKIVNCLLILILCINFLLIDIYIRKDSLLNGNPISMVLISPLQIMFYSDEEYRKMLKIVDYQGYISK